MSFKLSSVRSALQSFRLRLEPQLFKEAGRHEVRGEAAVQHESGLDGLALRRQEPHIHQVVTGAHKSLVLKVLKASQNIS